MRKERDSLAHSERSVHVTNTANPLPSKLQASSDATNISTLIKRDGDSYVINGKKWWTSGAGDPRCKLLIVMVHICVSVPLAWCLVSPPISSQREYSRMSLP